LQAPGLPARRIAAARGSLQQTDVDHVGTDAERQSHRWLCRK
jgi:hypothetical protein